MVFCYNLWVFGIVRGVSVYLFQFWYFVPRKIWQHWTILFYKLIGSPCRRLEQRAEKPTPDPMMIAIASAIL
jgi:hypothetical protein